MAKRPQNTPKGKPTDCRPLSLSDLKPAPYNPRSISDAALAALQTSLVTFGDISGIVWNRRTGHLVAGHQRLAALRQKHNGELAMVDGAIVTPDGERFAVRVVDWPEDKEKAANLAANSPYLAGAFDSAGLEALLIDLNAGEGLGTLLTDLRLNDLLPGASDLFPEVPAGDAADDSESGAVAGAIDTPEFVTFSAPLSAAQHQIVMDAIRLARTRGHERVADGLHAMALTYLQENHDG